MLQLKIYVAFLVAVFSQLIQSHPTSRSLGVPPFSGCGKSLPHGQAIGTTTNVSISSGGVERSYLVFIPPAYNSHLPTSLILSYHGGVRTALSQLQLDQLTSPEFNTGSMIIYPQGINVRVFQKNVNWICKR
jgi:poly(3-hydroxybutyrate) depolymerase